LFFPFSSALSVVKNSESGISHPHSNLSTFPPFHFSTSLTPMGVLRTAEIMIQYVQIC
jgi:hypothetical protein